MACVLASPSRVADRYRGMGVMLGLAEFVAEHRAGGELQVNDRAGTGSAQLIGDAPGLGESVSAGVVEHVNGAELMQGTQPPHGQPCRLRGRQGLLEGVPGSIQVISSQHAAEQFVCMAADLRTRLRRGQGAPGEGASPVDVVVGECDLGVQDGCLGGEAGLRVGREQVTGDSELPPCGSPPGSIDRRVGQLQVHRDPAGARAAARRQLGDQAVAGLHRLVDPAGQRQPLDEQHLGFGALLTVTEQLHSAAQRIDGGGERASAERGPASREQQGTSPVLLAGLEGQVGSQITPLPRQPRVSRLQGRECAGGEGDPPRWQQLGGHRLPGQHVPEPESIGVQDEQLCPDAVFQRVSDEGGVQPGRGLQQPPVELPPEQRGGVQDQALVITQRGQPRVHSVGERPWHA